MVLSLVAKALKDNLTYQSLKKNYNPKMASLEFKQRVQCVQPKEVCKHVLFYLSLEKEVACVLKNQTDNLKSHRSHYQ